MALYLAGKKIKFIHDNLLYTPNFLTIEDYAKPVIGIGKVGFMKIGGYYIEPRTTAVLGEGEVGYMIIGKEGVA